MLARLPEPPTDLQGLFFLVWLLRLDSITLFAPVATRGLNTEEDVTMAEKRGIGGCSLFVIIVLAILVAACLLMFM